MQERLIVTVKDLDSIVEPWADEKLGVEDLGPEKLPELARFNRKRGRADLQRLFSGYLEHGFHGFAAYSEDEFVGYYWWVDREVPKPYTDPHKLGLEIELGPEDVYGSHFFLLEEHRGGGAAGHFLFTVESTLRDRGFKMLWGYVAASNRPARWVYSTRGYKPMWVVRLRRVMGIQRTNREPL
jgi:GNAT superfamily N-acetyltransferase